MISPDSLIAVYLMASGYNGTLYAGVTSDLFNRVLQHKTKHFAGFSARYGCSGLVWFEPHASIVQAIAREKWIKHLPRAQKIRLIERDNSNWRDLSDGWFDETTWDFDGRYEQSLGAR
ncbi:MAG: GIY-YIG nuclease family protein [Proteobacteria bacterium]|nr:GIY-YIG nuclease family protein [Pseudomonadota bacterium]